MNTSNDLNINNKHKVLFVCHGNICRSPMAEFMMRRKLEDAGLAGKVEVASSAVSSEEIWDGVGNPVYPPAREMLRRHGLSCEGKRAVRLLADDYDRYDQFIAMDSSNIRGIMRIFSRGQRMILPDPEGKVRLLLDRDVADPWYTGDFTATWNDLEEGLDALISDLEKQLKG